mmetsp:Transcript_129739/g.225434  ORF Transcript_129739/g.225434 Transcript_129739/m.225434 type:complete len:379 (-) Transcript_129739:63-1199(-)
MRPLGHTCPNDLEQMAPSSKGRDTLDDVQVMGVWNFTIQPETPLTWLRTGLLDRYLLKFTMHAPVPAAAGFIFHAEADGPGTDGVSFWIVRSLDKEGNSSHRFMLAGEGLDSRPVSTRKVADANAEEIAVDVEVLVQGDKTVIFLQNRSVKVSCRTKMARGSLAFYNSTRVAPDKDDASAEVHFSGIRITALRRGPLEISGFLGRRERALMEEPAPLELSEPVEAEDVLVDDEMQKASRATDSTWAPESSAGMQFVQTDATSFHDATMRPASEIPARRSTAPGRSRRQPPSRSISTASGPFGRGNSASTQQRLRHSASDSTLRKNGRALCGLSSAGRTRGAADSWVPLALNAPASQKKFMGDTHPSLGRSECTDFIRM